MFRYRRKLFSILILSYFLSTCIDPYYPDLKYVESLLVVDALLTNENISYLVKLSRSNVVQSSDPEMVSGALVNIRDDNGNNTLLQETAAGIYKTDSLLFRGETGRSYILSIKTAEGEEYESDPSVMYPVQDIEKITYYKDQTTSQDNGLPDKGIRLYIDTRQSDDTRFLRWIYDEWWKIIVPEPKRYDYIDQNTIVEVSQVKQTCWGNHLSDDIIIKSYDHLRTNESVRTPILFVSSTKSTRFLIRYTIEIKQLSLSENEYAYWDQMQQISAIGGDIFEKQPFPVMGNIHSKSEPDEMVLGYFQVSAVSKKRIYINSNEIADLDIPFYRYDCDRITLGPDDFVSDIGGRPPTMDQIYSMYAGDTYSFVEPVYTPQGKLSKLGFAKHVCTDCTLNGTLTRPDFWEDQ